MELQVAIVMDLKGSLKGEVVIHTVSCIVLARSPRKYSNSSFVKHLYFPQQTLVVLLFEPMFASTHRWLGPTIQKINGSAGGCVKPC